MNAEWEELELAVGSFQLAAREPSGSDGRLVTCDRSSQMNREEGRSQLIDENAA
jgi:hypothetical protein